MSGVARKGRQRPLRMADTTLRLLQRAGYVSASSRRDSPYSFHEMVLLRTVGALQAAGIPTRSINRALRELRPWVDGAAPISRIILDASAVGVRVREGTSQWRPDSGQYELPLEKIRVEAHVVPIVSDENKMKQKHSTAHGHYLRGAGLEETDVDAAREAYEACLAGDCRHLEARINLGRLLHLQGLLDEAEQIYNAHEEPSAILYFNLGVLLEDLKRELDAIEAYRKAIVHDPGMADAHFNLSLLHERLGEAQAAFRHLLAYKRTADAHQSTERV
jgi:tetratricopeptide (TPR) repeat protein